jgi:hypothetical protein
MKQAILQWISENLSPNKKLKLPTLEKPSKKNETEKAELTDAWNFLNLSLKHSEAEKAYFHDANASLLSLTENYETEMKEKEEKH